MDFGVAFPLTNSLLASNPKQQEAALFALKQLAILGTHVVLELRCAGCLTQAVVCMSDEFQIEIARLVNLGRLSTLMKSKNKDVAEEGMWLMMTLAQNSKVHAHTLCQNYLAILKLC